MTKTEMLKCADSFYDKLCEMYDVLNELNTMIADTTLVDSPPDVSAIADASDDAWNVLADVERIIACLRAEISNSDLLKD